MSKALTALGSLFTITRVAQATNGFDSSKGSRRTAPQSLRFFCARVMAGCAWGAYSPAGFLDTGLSTPRTARHHSFDSGDGKLQI